MPLKLEATGRLVWFLAVIAITGTVVTFGLGVLLAFTTGDYRTLLSHQLLTPIITAAYAIIGALVASRHPRNPLGWIFLAVGWLYTITVISRVYQTHGTGIFGTASVRAVVQNLWIPALFLPTTFVFLLFPDGSLLSRRWRPVLWSAVLGMAAMFVALAFHPGPVPEWGVDLNPNGIAELAGVLTILLQLAGPLLGIGFVGSIVSFVLRFRRSRGNERRQMKWLAYAISLLLLNFAVGMLTWPLWADNALATELNIAMTNLAILGIAVATSIAILRYRLWDIDVVINRTLVYGTLTASVALIYVLVVGTLGTVIQVEGNLLISLLATGLIAVLFQPLRERLQRTVNRLMYGDRDEPFEALARLGRRLEAIFSPAMVYPTIVETVAQSLKLPYAAITVKGEEQFEIVEKYGSVSRQLKAYPLTHQREVIGQLLVGQRSQDEHFSAADERLLRNFARQIGAAVHAVQLTADLRRSRQQLVTAREEERRRLRRDLHDGLGPILASVVWQADSAREMVVTDPSEAGQLLDRSIEQARAALADIRRLVYGLRPPALDELGLVGALEQTGRQYQPVAVRIEAPLSLPAFPAAVEVAAYRIVQEALKNAVDHGRAEHCVVWLEVAGNFCLTICDDGRGLPEVVKPGVGLVSMRERAEELGGTFMISRLLPTGTVVEVTLPLD